MNIDQITGRHDVIIDREELKELRKEIMEQARLNGMGAERELHLRAEIERLTKIVNEQKAEIERLVIQLEDPHKP